MILLLLVWVVRQKMMSVAGMLTDSARADGELVAFQLGK